MRTWAYPSNTTVLYPHETEMRAFAEVIHRKHLSTLNIEMILLC